MCFIYVLRRQRTAIFNALFFLSRCNQANLKARVKCQKQDSNGATILFKYELIQVTATGDTFVSKLEKSEDTKSKFGDCTEFETLKRFFFFFFYNAEGLKI